MSAWDQETKEENREVSDWLLFVEERRRDYNRSREEIEQSTANPDGSGIYGSEPGDPTGRLAARLLKLAQTKKWIDLVDEVEEGLPEKMRIFLRVRRECRHAGSRPGRRGRPPWVPYVQRRYAEELAKLLGKREEDVWISSPTTLFDRWEKIVGFAVRKAIRRGLV